MRTIKNIRELKIGDRICVERTDNNGYIIGNGKFNIILGRVITRTRDQYGHILIEFDENIEGHDGGGLGRDGHCWCINGAYLKTYKISKILKKKHNFY